MPETAPATDLITRRERLARRARHGACWFYGVAALSLVDSLVALVAPTGSFGLGLGISQVFDALAAGYADGVANAWAMRALGLAPSVAAVAIYALYGWLASHPRTGAFVCGLVFYVLDGLLLVAAGDVLGAGVHLVVLVLIGRGLKASVDLGMMRKPPIAAEMSSAVAPTAHEAHGGIPDPIAREIDAVIDSIAEFEADQTTGR
jgi:hypothetical protein